MRFKVHSCTRDPIEVDADFNGQKVKATVLGLTVELVPEDGGPSQTLRFVPKDMEKDEATFEVGGIVVVSYKKEIQA